MTSPDHFLSSPHSLTADEVAGKLQTRDGGLTNSEAAERLESAGFNKLPEAEKTGVVLRFLKHFHDTMIYLLIGAAVDGNSMGNPPKARSLHSPPRRDSPKRTTGVWMMCRLNRKINSWPP